MWSQPGGRSVYAKHYIHAHLLTIYSDISKCYRRSTRELCGKYLVLCDCLVVDSDFCPLRRRSHDVQTVDIMAGYFIYIFSLILTNHTHKI